LVTLTLVGPACHRRDWPAYGYDHRHISRQPHEAVLRASSVATLHTTMDFVIPLPGEGVVPPGVASFTASPTVYDNTVYIGGLNGRFYAVYASGPNKGTLRWKYPPALQPNPPDPCGTTTAPLLIASGSGNPSGPGIASSAAVVRKVAGHAAVVVFGAPDPNSNWGDGRLWALDAASGACIWKSDVIAPTGGTSKIGYSSPAIAHERAYVGVSAKQPDWPITRGRVYAVHLSTGTKDPAFQFASTGVPPPGSTVDAGGGVWSSPAITPSGNVVVTTGNSCNNSNPDCTGAIPLPDRTGSMLKLDWHSGNVLWQIQPVDVDWDFDPDWAASPIVGQVGCGTLAISVQKDGYVHAANIKTGGPFVNPACSYPGHSLDCPRWTFPTVPHLPFQEDGHDDTRFLRPGALDGDHVFITAGGLNLTELGPTGHYTNPPGRIDLARIYSLNCCGSDLDRIRWILDLDGTAGAPSIANRVVYVGTGAGTLYAIADIDVMSPDSSRCSYPNVAAGSTCTMGGFRTVVAPHIVRKVSLSGSIPGIPAISNGHVFVATTSGHLYGLEP
jgi:outer membrane protein assembly factor BamB